MPIFSANHPPTYPMSNGTLRQGVELILGGVQKPIIKDCPWFYDYPALRAIFNVIYRSLGYVDEHAERTVMTQKSVILKAVVQACQCQEVQTIQINYPNSDHPTTFELWQDVKGRLLLRRPGEISGQIIEKDLLSADLENMKSEALRAYIQCEKEAGRVVDLSSTDLSGFNLDGIEFTGMKIRAEDLAAIARLGRPIKLVDFEVEGEAPADLRYLEARISKSQALYLINAGVDKRIMIAQYLQTEHELSHTNIDLGGFDLRGLALQDFDFRGANFSKTIIGDAADNLTPQARQASVIVDANIVRAQLDYPISELFGTYFFDDVILSNWPDFIDPPTDFQQVTQQQWAFFAKRLDVTHERGVVLRGIKAENLRLYNGKIFFLNRNTCCTKSTVLRAAPIDPLTFLPAQLLDNLKEDCAEYQGSELQAERIAQVCKKLDQFATLITAMQIFGYSSEEGDYSLKGIEAYWVKHCPEWSVKRLFFLFLQKPFHYSLAVPMSDCIGKLNIDDRVQPVVPAPDPAPVPADDVQNGIRLIPSSEPIASDTMKVIQQYFAEQASPPVIQSNGATDYALPPLETFHLISVEINPEVPTVEPSSEPQIKAPGGKSGITVLSQKELFNTRKEAGLFGLSQLVSR